MCTCHVLALNCFDGITDSPKHIKIVITRLLSVDICVLLVIVLSVQLEAAKSVPLDTETGIPMTCQLLLETLYHCSLWHCSVQWPWDAATVEQSKTFVPSSACSQDVSVYYTTLCPCGQYWPWCCTLCTGMCRNNPHAAHGFYHVALTLWLWWYSGFSSSPGIAGKGSNGMPTSMPVSYFEPFNIGLCMLQSKVKLSLHCHEGI